MKKHPDKHIQSAIEYALLDMDCAGEFLTCILPVTVRVNV